MTHVILQVLKIKWGIWNNPSNPRGVMQRQSSYSEWKHDSFWVSLECQANISMSETCPDFPREKPNQTSAFLLPLAPGAEMRVWSCRWCELFQGKLLITAGGILQWRISEREFFLLRQNIYTEEILTSISWAVRQQEEYLPWLGPREFGSVERSWAAGQTLMSRDPLSEGTHRHGQKEIIKLSLF